MQGRAAVLEEFHGNLQVNTFQLPSLEPGAALVRTEMAGICGTDVHLWRGELPIQLPVILGHETVGRIEQLAPGLTHDWNGQPLRLGDRVTWTSTISCGKCFYCAEKKQPTRCPHRRAYGIGYRCDQPPHFLGGYAQYHYLRPGSNIFRIPDELSTEAVIGAGCALITAIHGIERTGIAWQDLVVVQGAGPVGIAALAVAKTAGAAKVIVLGAPASRLDLARQFGADVTLNIEEISSPEDRIAAVRELTGGYGADVVLECVGIPGAVVEGMEMCRDGGKYLVLGHYCDAGKVEWNPHVITRKQLQVFGSWSSEPRHMKTALEFLARRGHEFPFQSMVTHRFPLDQANEALAATAKWQSAKSVIVPLLLCMFLLLDIVSLAAQDHRGVQFFGFDSMDSFERTENNGRTTLLSPLLKPDVKWDELIVSWNYPGAPTNGMRIDAKVFYEAHETSWYTLAHWALDPTSHPRESVRHQNDEHGRVDTDILKMKQPGGAAQLRIVIDGPPDLLKFLALCFAERNATQPPLETDRKGWGSALEVVQRSQANYPEGISEWCSPTSLSMVLSFWGEKLNRPELHYDVPEVARAVHDPGWPGTGNWPFNTAFAGAHPGIRAYVTRFTHLSEIEPWLNAGVPVIASVRYGLLKGRSERGNGHLIVCLGFTQEGDLVVNDPGRLAVRQTYSRENFTRAWADSLNTVYLVYPEDWKVPPDRFGHWFTPE